MNQYCPAISCLFPVESTGSSSEVYITRSSWDTLEDPHSKVVPCRRYGVPFKPFRVEQLFSCAIHAWDGVYPLVDWTDYPKEVLKRQDSLGQHSQKILGPEIESRIELFKRYPDGWDAGMGRSMQLGCIAMLDCFVNKFSDFGAAAPSLFLTRGGNLQLSWEDQSGEPIEVEFFPNKIEYYIASKQQEGEVGLDPENPIDALDRVVQLISR